MASHEQPQVAETSGWLMRASQDMRAAAHGLKADPPLLDDIVFHCQQAVEKSLRGFLAWHQRKYPETHDIALIGRECVEIDPTLESLIADAAPLSDYAWKYRYPGGDVQPSVEDANHALNVTHQVAEAIIARLPREARQG